MKLQVFNNGFIDLGLGTRGLAFEDTLASAVIVSLLCERRAGFDDQLPDALPTTGLIPPDRRGWWGDALDVDGYRVGSRLWLLKREKQTEETRRRAQFYAEEALQWIVDDGHAVTIDVAAAWHASELGRLEMQIDVTLPDGTVFSEEVSYVI